MAARDRYNWPALKAEFVHRRCTEEGTLTLAQFAREKGITPCSVKKHASRESWMKAVEEMKRRVGDEVERALEIDQVQVRLDLLSHRSPLARTAEGMVRLYQRRVLKSLEAVEKGEEPEYTPTPTEIKRVYDIYVRLSEVGGGLPREYSVSVDDSHSDLVANREHMRSLEDFAERLAEWRGRKAEYKRRKRTKEGTE